jgi:putative endonuclease
MSNNRISLGKKGEKLAINYLKKRGCSIRSSNFRTRLGEIDIVAEDNGTIIFVEVKTRTGTMYGAPYEAVTKIKQVQLSKVALEYLNQYDLNDSPARFDVISIVHADGEKPEIELIKNAFELCFGF